MSKQIHVGGEVFRPEDKRVYTCTMKEAIPLDLLLLAPSNLFVPPPSHNTNSFFS